MDCTIALINTVAENREGFTCQEYEGAKAERRALGLVGYPLKQNFTNMVCSNMITNFPVAPRDIKKSDKIFVPDVPSKKDK